MNPYSLDLRQRVISKVQDGERTQTAIAADFDLSDATVENWWRQWRETGTLAPKPFAGGAMRTLQACAAEIREAVQQQPDATLQELCDTVESRTGLHASPSMMCRELKILNLPRKKVPARQSTRHTARASTAPKFPGQRHRTTSRRRGTSQIHR